MEEASSTGMTGIAERFNIGCTAVSQARGRLKKEIEKDKLLKMLVQEIKKDIRR
jgi:hypothetical protein